MPFKFNVFTGNFDIVDEGILGPPITTDEAIVRWDGTSGKFVSDSKTRVQDGGAIQTQAILQNRNIVEDVTVPDAYVWIGQDINLLTGNITLEGDGEITLVN